MRKKNIIFEIVSVENMTQLIWPSLYQPDLQYAIDECKIVAQKIYGDDMEHDFDMMICKNTNVATPWHQVSLEYTVNQLGKNL